MVCWSSRALLLPAAGNERCFGMMMMSLPWLLTVWKTNLFIPTRPTLSSLAKGKFVFVAIRKLAFRQKRAGFVFQMVVIIDVKHNF